MEYNYKFKVGDKVRVRKDLQVESYNGTCVTNDMLQHRGKTVTISERSHHQTNAAYRLEEDKKRWYWTEDMLEPFGKFKVGDKVRVRKDLKGDSMYNNVYAPSAMEALRGKVMTISELCTYCLNPFYHLAEDEKMWYWSDDMLEPVSEPARKRFQPTDTIVITTDGTETRAYHKRGGKVIAESKCMRNPADTHDLRTAAGLCIDRLIGEKPAQETYYNGKVFMVVLEEAWIPAEVKTGHIYEVKDGLFSCFKDHEILCNKRFKTIDEIAEYFDEGALVYEIQGEVLHDK